MACVTIGCTWSGTHTTGRTRRDMICIPLGCKHLKRFKAMASLPPTNHKNISLRVLKIPTDSLHTYQTLTVGSTLSNDVPVILLIDIDLSKVHCSNLTNKRLSSGPFHTQSMYMAPHYTSRSRVNSTHQILGQPSKQHPPHAGRGGEGRGFSVSHTHHMPGVLSTPHIGGGGGGGGGGVFSSKPHPPHHIPGPQ